MANQLHSVFQRKSLGAFNGFSAAVFAKQLAAENNEMRQDQAVLGDTFQRSVQAQHAMAQLQEFATTTPFEVEELIAAFVKLANEGFELFSFCRFGSVIIISFYCICCVQLIVMKT